MNSLSLLFLSLFLELWLSSLGLADVYVYKDKQGVLTFTNVPTHEGFRRVIREGGAR